MTYTSDKVAILRFTTPKRLIRVLTILAMTIAIAGCKSNSGTATASDSIPSVTVSIDPLQFFAEAIGGDSIAVTTLLPQGTDPETFEPGTSMMRTLARSKAFIRTGTLPFENALITNLKTNNPSLAIFSVNDGITPIYGTHSHSHAESHAHDSDEADPHIWSSVRNARIIAGNMLKALVEVAPQHKEYYTERHGRLTQHLDSLDRNFSQILDSLPSRTFVAWHPSLSYFARDYNLEQIALNAENKETSPLRVRQLIAQASARHPVAFIIPDGMNPNQFESTADALSIKPAAINLMSADWEGGMRQLVSAFSN